MIKDHYDAVQTLLTDDETLTDKVFDTARLDQQGVLIRDNYIILLGGAPNTLDDGREGTPQQPDSKATWGYKVRAVGVNGDAVRAVQQKAMTLLVGAVPTVTDRSCDPIRFIPGGEPIKMDASVKPPLFFGDINFTFLSRRA